MVSARRLFLRQNRVLAHTLGGASVIPRANWLENDDLLRMPRRPSKKVHLPMRAMLHVEECAPSGP